MAASRILRWTALTCSYGSIRLFFGLAATLDDSLTRRLHPRQVAVFPYLSIRVAEGTDRQIPLRYYAVRDPSIIEVRPLAREGLDDGYERVSLEFQFDVQDEEQSEDGQIADDPRGEPVMAFILSIGVDMGEEERFFDSIVGQFPRHTWMTLPRVLRRIGCLDVSAGAGE